MNTENNLELLSNPISEISPDKLNSSSLDRFNNEDIYELTQGNAFTLEETYKITSESKSNFVVLAGASGCGKTTLITSMYQMFHKGPFANYFFAGSETLSGFEQRAFLTRICSGNLKSQTPKTRRGILDSILHLKLWIPENNIFHNLLMADFSGEDYKGIIGNVDYCIEEFGVIRSANNIVLLIDGELISDRKNRHGAQQEALQLLQTLSDAELISKNVNLIILFSKYDIILQKLEENPSTLDYIKILSKKFEEKFSSKVKTIKFFNIAAMHDNKNIIDIGHGLKDLLRAWIEYDTNSIVGDYKDVFQLPVNSKFNLFAKRIRGGI